MAGDFLTQFSTLVRSAAENKLDAWGVSELVDSISLERPAVREHGDLSLNIAMVAAGRVGRPPRELASELLADLESDSALSGACKTIDIAGAGFINFFLSDHALVKAVVTAFEQGDAYGSGGMPSPTRILLEFVSANPTGPLHVGHARYAAYGDSLKRILAFAGFKVSTEFYINDYGSQMELFGRSLAVRYAQARGRSVELPEDGYKGTYLIEISEELAADIGDEMLDAVYPEPTNEAISFFRDKGCRMVLDDIRSNLERFRVTFDSWFSEASLYEKSALDSVIEEMKRAGDVREEEGALWLNTSRYGDDKDRVLIRGTGEPTYFASDIAYHQDKLERGFDHLIDIWGADHHGYVQRVKAAFEAMSHDPGKLEIIIGQLVNVLEMGEKQQMSKRAGKMVTLTELLDSIGIDAARFFLVDRSHDSTLDLDLEKAKLQSEENPVYYVQYAHARISSIMKRAENDGVKTAAYEVIPLEEEERTLILKLLDLPGIVLAAADTRGPHRLTSYARELAAAFHVFYHNCPVIKAEPQTAAFRLDLCGLTRNAIRICLNLVGVTAPESM